MFFKNFTDNRKMTNRIVVFSHIPLPNIINHSKTNPPLEQKLVKPLVTNELNVGITDET